LTLCGVGLPSGLIRRAATRIGTSDGWQLIPHAACPAVSRAGGHPRHPLADSDPYVKFHIRVVMLTLKLCAPDGFIFITF
jgi:hypothetical protein